MSNLLMKIRKNVNKNEKGFTLIEMVVVIAIIAILAAVFINRYGAFTENARGQTVLAEAKMIATAIDAYYIENGEYLAADAAADGTNATTIKTKAGVTGILTLVDYGGFTYSNLVKSKTYIAQRAKLIAADKNKDNTQPVKLN